MGHIHRAVIDRPAAIIAPIKDRGRFCVNPNKK